MNISVVIVNFNGGPMLRKCVRSCVDEGVLPGEIIVVDNGSMDESCDLPPEFGAVQILRIGCNVGFARAVNKGIRQATQNFILIHNNDARLLPGAITSLLQCVARFPQAAFVGARLVNPEGRPQNVVAEFPHWWSDLIPNFVRKVRRKNPKMLGVEQAVDVPSLIGAAFLVRRQALERLGLLDEDFFFYLEETEWCHRAHQKGFQVIFCPEARVEHGLGGTANRYKAEARIEFHRSRLIYARKVEGTTARNLLLGVLFASSFINFLSNAVLLVLTLFAFSKLRRKTAMYGRLWLWHLLGRPVDWGLPNKCPELRK
ncbi:glycosyltransferase family 2 protein [Acidithiobacillus sp. AC3]